MIARVLRNADPYLKFFVVFGTVIYLLELSTEAKNALHPHPFFVWAVSVQRPSRFFGAVGLANWAKKGHPLWPSGAPDPGGIEAISRW